MPIFLFVLAILLYVYSCVTDSVYIFLIANSFGHQFHMLLKPFVTVYADMFQPDFCLFCIMFSYKVFFLYCGYKSFCKIYDLQTFFPLTGGLCFHFLKFYFENFYFFNFNVVEFS